MGAFKIGQNIWLWLLGGGSGTNESQLNENLGSIMSQSDMEKKWVLVVVCYCIHKLEVGTHYPFSFDIF